MDTKRCLRCHKLLRADAQKCSLCGYVFLQAPVRRSSKATNGARHSATASFPSNAPASPHRAGHYSGLHPEDQPYQSSFMPILRPPAITRRLDQKAEDVLEPITVSSTPFQEVHEEEREQTPKRYVAAPVPMLSPMPQRSTGVLSKMDTPLPLLEVEPPMLIPEPTLHEQITAPLPVHLTGKRQPHSRIVRILVVVAVLLFLLASSILTYFVVFAGRGGPVHPPANAVRPGNQQGQSIAPQLQLSTSHIDFGAVNTHNALTLLNAGDQEVNWQAKVDSNSSWLSITPTFGTIAKQKVVTVTVDRSNLISQIYTGYINFFQQGTYTALKLKVTMSVTTRAATVTASPPPMPTAGPLPQPAIAISQNALTFNAIQGSNPAAQEFNLTNPGNTPLNWSITITGDANATTWLSLSSKSGNVAPGNSVPITVTPNVVKLTAGAFNATITIQNTDPGISVKSQQVAVKITISNQALISVAPTNIACNLSNATTSSTQQLQITNSGSATLNWALSQSLPAWVSVDTTSGILPPGYIAFVNVACNNTALQAGTYTYTLVVSDTDSQTPVVPQNVQITLTVS